MLVPEGREPITPESISNMSFAPRVLLIIQSPDNQLYRLRNGSDDPLILEPHDGLPTTPASQQTPRITTSMPGLSTTNTNALSITPGPLTVHGLNVGDPIHNNHMHIPMSVSLSLGESSPPHWTSVSQPGITVPFFGLANDETLLGLEHYFSDGITDFEAMDPVTVAPVDTSRNDLTGSNAPRPLSG